MLTPFFLLVVLALIFTVCGMIWSSYPLVPVAVLLLCVALLLRGG